MAGWLDTHREMQEIQPCTAPKQFAQEIASQMLFNMAGYDIALATDMTGGNEVQQQQVSSVARGTNFLMLSAQVRGDHDYLLIYTRSFRGRQAIAAK
eukprot:6278449-Amphidinium_carterae.2